MEIKGLPKAFDNNTEEMWEIINIFLADLVDVVGFIHVGDDDFSFDGGEKNQLNIHFDGEAKKIVIPSITLHHTDKGYGERVLTLLEKFAKREGYKSIELLFVYDKVIHEFAENNNFTRLKVHSETDFGNISNWIKQVG